LINYAPLKYFTEILETTLTNPVIIIQRAIPSLFRVLELLEAKAAMVVVPFTTDWAVRLVL
jgi:hypothetical protein